MAQQVKRTVLHFNEEMNHDLQQIRIDFQKRFRIVPSYNDIMKLLLKTYKEKNIEIVKRHHPKNEFIIRF